MDGNGGSRGRQLTMRRRPASGAILTWERRSEWPLAAAAGLFLLVYAWPILDPGISHRSHRACDHISYAIWVIFAVDYVIRVALTEHRVRYIGRHIPDLAVIALPLLRPLRLLRLVYLIRALNRGAMASLRGRIIVYVTGATTLLIFCAALAVLDAERGRPHANIETFPDALWWAATTITTVGYGDRFPSTGQGRLVAVGLMIGGIALLGIVTASIATWLLDQVKAEEDAAQAITRADLSALTEEIRQLRALIDSHGLNPAEITEVRYP